MKNTISTLSNYERLTAASGTKVIRSKTGKAILAQVVLACLMPLTMWAQNLLPNPGFEKPAPGVPPGTTVSYTNLCANLVSSAAAEWGSLVDICGGDIATTLVPSTAPGGGKYMMHVVTNYSNSGVAQSEGFADQAKTIASAWVYVNSGCVGIGTGNAAYTVGMDEITCETGTWVQFKVPNSGSPANTFVIYAYLNTGADFYVDNVKVVAAP